MKQTTPKPDSKTAILSAAYHEAGHLVAYAQFGITIGWVSVEVDEHGRASGQCHHYGLPVVQPDFFDQHAVISLAGPIAELVHATGRHYKQPHWITLIFGCGGKGDFEDMERVAEFYGIKGYRTRCIKKAVELVRDRWSDIETWAQKIADAPGNSIVVDDGLSGDGRPVTA